MVYTRRLPTVNPIIFWNNHCPNLGHFLFPFSTPLSFPHTNLCHSHAGGNRVSQPKHTTPPILAPSSPCHCKAQSWQSSHTNQSNKNPPKRGDSFLPYCQSFTTEYSFPSLLTFNAPLSDSLNAPKNVLSPTLTFNDGVLLCSLRR